MHLLLTTNGSYNFPSICLDLGYTWLGWTFWTHVVKLTRLDSPTVTLRFAAPLINYSCLVSLYQPYSKKSVKIHQTVDIKTRQWENVQGHSGHG